MYDLVIENGLIMDGSGAPPLRGGVAVRRGLIAEMGPSITAHSPARERLDAQGRVVCPGFINMHSHSDAQYMSNQRLEAALLQGVTLEVTGQCGISLVPARPHKLDTHLSYLRTQFPAAFVDALDWERMQDTGDYARQVSALPHTIHAAPLVGHGTLRNAVMGFDAAAPTPAQQRLMEEILAKNLQDGAWGLSLGLVYPPGNFAELPELVGLGKVVARHGGIVSAHIRRENGQMQEMIDLARQSGAHVHMAHLKLLGRACWGRAEALLATLAQARAEGLRITADQYPYTGSSTGLSVLVPQWALEGGIAAFLQRLAGPERPAVLAGIAAEMEQRGGPHAVMVAAHGLCPGQEVRRVDQWAQAAGAAPEAVVARMLENSRAAAKAVYFSMCQADVTHIMQSDFVAVGSDGYAVNFDEAGGAQHPRSFGTFPRFLRTVQDLQLMPLEKAVWKITGLAASIMGFERRGRLAPGMAADVTVFDPASVGDTATFEQPFQKPKGIAAVIVGGQLTARDNALTSARAGAVCLRGAGVSKMNTATACK